LLVLGGGFGAGRWSALRPSPDAGPAVLDFSALGEAHRRLVASGASAEVKSAGPEALGRSLTPLVRFPVSPVDLRPEETRLVGGSRQVVQGAPVACLHYEWEGERISLFQMDARRLTPPALKHMPARAENYVAQRHGGLSYVAWS